MEATKQKIYIAMDVEADGPVPGLYSMLSFGAAAFYPNGTHIDLFAANLETLPDAAQDPETMEWWASKEAMYKACRKDAQPPQEVMKNFLRWITSLPGEPIMVGYVATFDYMFIVWYLIKFTGQNPFLHYAIDIKTYIMAVLKVNLHDVCKRKFPPQWITYMTRSHFPIVDAKGHGRLFCKICTENMGPKK